LLSSLLAFLNPISTLRYQTPTAFVIHYAHLRYARVLLLLLHRDLLRLRNEC
jgi:hypothetical protein